MKTFVTILVTMLLVVVFLGIVTTQEAEQLEEQPIQMSMMQMMMGRMFTHQMLLPLADELRLNKEQVTSIQKIALDLQKEIIRKNAELSIAEIELNALLSQDKIDLKQTREKIQQLATLSGELRIAQIKAFIEAKEVLTDEQRGLLFTWMSQYERHDMVREIYEKRLYTNNGERIYYTATNDSDQKIPFGDGPPWFRMIGGSCVNCHGADGKGGIPVMMTSVVAPGITYQSLTGGDHAHHGHEHEAGTTYTDELIKRAITDGISASGYPLIKAMPRWKMSEKDQNDLLEYLKILDD
ncbi:periplasmic heavy metal sensor [bacterium]|nr:periplasmic heavy metal sensor [bacterium]